MRMPRIALIAVLPFAAIACSEDAQEPDAVDQAKAPTGEFAKDNPTPPPPASGWDEDEGFADDGGADGSSGSVEDSAQNPEDLR